MKQKTTTMTWDISGFEGGKEHAHKEFRSRYIFLAHLLRVAVLMTIGWTKNTYCLLLTGQARPAQKKKKDSVKAK